MNRNGFTLVELLGSMILLAIILGIGLYSTRGTLSTTLSTISDVSLNEIYNSSKTYVLENDVSWINGENEYTCLTVFDLVDNGYFNEDEVLSYKDDIIKVERDINTKVITTTSLVDVCK